MKITDMTHDQAREFFFENENYCSISLPTYFNFEPLLKNLSLIIPESGYQSVQKHIKSIQKPSPLNASDFDDVNYRLYHNKDGAHDWRPLEIIHPVLYVALVKAMTQQNTWAEILNRLRNLSSTRIECVSMLQKREKEKKNRGRQIKEWADDFEKRSIELSLEYDYLVETDIVSCYSSIYTHSIAWALHGKNKAKDNRKKIGLIGNLIDTYILEMNCGQTNGIPQGSALMDFIAEIVLAYFDNELNEVIKKNPRLENFKILRYRDDYRIFSEEKYVGDEIIKLLSVVLRDGGLKLSLKKTKSSENIIQQSIKESKMEWITSINKKEENNSKMLSISNYKKTFYYKELLIIHNFSLKFPNAGVLTTELMKIIEAMDKNNISDNENLHLLSGVAVDIAYRNTNLFPQVATIISYILSKMNNVNEKKELINIVLKKMRKLPNTLLIELWLQRVALKIPNMEIDFCPKICRIVKKGHGSLWRNVWINKNSGLRGVLATVSIIDKTEIEKLAEIISSDNELKIFEYEIL